MAPPKVKSPFLREKDEDTLKAFGLCRATMPMVAKNWGLTEGTLYDWIKKEPWILEAIKRGREEADSAVVQTAYQMAVSGKEPAMTMFWLKTQCRWREVDREGPTINNNFTQNTMVLRMSNEEIIHKLNHARTQLSNDPAIRNE